MSQPRWNMNGFNKFWPATGKRRHAPSSDYGVAAQQGLGGDKAGPDLSGMNEALEIWTSEGRTMLEAEEAGPWLSKVKGGGGLGLLVHSTS
ncbi:hypothetical protein VCV18_012006 [Metarhizium anisopliae]